MCTYTVDVFGKITRTLCSLTFQSYLVFTHLHKEESQGFLRKDFRQQEGSQVGFQGRTQPFDIALWALPDIVGEVFLDSAVP